MVDAYLRARDITAERVLAAFQRVPRHLFVPPEYAAQAYEDHPLPIGEEQTISQPYMVAIMTQMLDVRPTDRVLEIGTGSSYQTAILAELAKQVVSVERHAPLHQRARERLAALNYTNITTICADGTLGYADAAPYDRILVTAGSPSIPHVLEDQLAIGGCLICPVGPRNVQRLVKVTRTAQGIDSSDGLKCVFVPLIGQNGWEHT